MKRPNKFLWTSLYYKHKVIKLGGERLFGS